MKIACLQFAPQVGDVDNNLNRADAVLSRANVEDLLGLDLLVLPELAFSGYNFHSLRSIAPFLEPPGSGISSLWARTTALRHDCVVVVGYPEKVDVTPKWPASPEYYNSALVVNSDGETIANYRKSFLYHTDETWALEGRDGFFHEEIPGIGSVAMGICMDINPYKFEAPWDDFEFGWHVVNVTANVVILTMAWHTHRNTRLFSQRPQEPDLETLVYWVQRLEPLIAAKREDEVIVIFCNRTGSEDELMYAGTSAVLGIKNGEVFVYGLLGRAVKELLVVDTSRPPMSKLASTEEIKVSSPQSEDLQSYDSAYDPMETPGMMKEYAGVHGVEGTRGSMNGSDLSPYSPSSTSPFSPVSSGGSGMLSPTELFERQWPLSPLSPRSMEAVLEEPTSPARLHFLAGPLAGGRESIDRALWGSHVDSQLSPTYPDPAQGAITRHRALPKLAIPSTPWRFHRQGSPLQKDPNGPQPQVLTGKVAMTPMTAFDIESVWDSPKLSQQQATIWPSVRRPNSDVTAQPQVRTRKYRSVYSPESPKAFVYQRDEEKVQGTVEGKSAQRTASWGEGRLGKKETQRLTMQGLERLNEEEELKQVVEEQEISREPELNPESEAKPKPEVNPGLEANPEHDAAHHDGAIAVVVEDDELIDLSNSEDENEPRLDAEERTESLNELSAALECLRIAERRPGSAFDEQEAQGGSTSPCPDRPYSPKSLNVSRQGSRTRMVPIHVSDSVLADRASVVSTRLVPIHVSDSVLADRASVVSSASIPISLSPSLFDTADGGELQLASIISHIRELSSAGIDRPASRMGNGPGSIPVGRRRRSLELINGRSKSLPGAKEIPRSKVRASSTAGHGGQEGGRRPRSLLRFSISRTPEPEEKPEGPENKAETDQDDDPRLDRSQQARAADSGPRPRIVSRGRQPGARGTSVERSKSVGEKRSEVSRRRSVHKRLSMSSQLVRYDVPPNVEPTAIISENFGPRYLPGGEDEIIAVITMPRNVSATRTRDASRAGKKNPYDITLQPFTSPPLIRARAGNDPLVSASSASTFESTPGPFTPDFISLTPEPMIVIGHSGGSVQGEERLEPKTFEPELKLREGRMEDFWRDELEGPVRY